MTNNSLEILIVEDSPTQAELLKSILEQKSYCVSVARSGEEALTIMSRHAPTLVISDINMPGIDGYELCRRIRSHEELKKLPVILLTSLADPKDVLKGLECGADNFITKPYDPKQLLSRVQNICSSLELRRDERMQMGVEVFFGGQRHFITSERQQILDLLLATYETAVQVNLDLKKTQAELKALNKDLEGRVVERTAALQQELEQRKRAEERIREQATLLDKARDAITVRDLSQRILYWNNGAERLYGWNSAEVLGKSIYEFVSNVSPKEEEALKEVLAKGEWSGELREGSRLGKAIIVESRRTLLYDQQGVPKSVLIINTDISEKKLLEEQFLRAQRMETIGALAGGVAHDLNNVLAPILMASELLQDDAANDLTRKMLETITVSAKRGSEIVRQILSFARGNEPEKSILQVKHLVKELVKLAKQTLPRSIQITSDVPNDLWPITGDATQVDQVLMNLFVNARDAMEPGGGTLSISAENVLLKDKTNPMLPASVSGRYVILTVADTGCGIPPEALGRIFEPFFTTKQIGKGTGLGLSTVAAILKTHQGFAEVSSSPSQGTEFKIYFPAIESDATAPKEAQASEPPTGAGEWILLVDDEQALLEMSRVMLASFNYNVITANSGVDGLRLFTENAEEIAVLITDMMMPGLGGQALIKAARALKPSLPVIVTTGLGSDHALPDSADVSAVLTKPFKLEEFLETISKTINGAVKSRR